MKNILGKIVESENVRDLVIILEDLIKAGQLSRNLTVVILTKAQELKSFEIGGKRYNTLAEAEKVFGGQFKKDRTVLGIS